MADSKGYCSVCMAPYQGGEAISIKVGVEAVNEVEYIIQPREHLRPSTIRLSSFLIE